MAESSETQLSKKIQDALNTKGLSIRDFARGIRVTYEHARRIVRGESDPSDLRLKEICSFLELDFAEMNYLLATDKIEKKYGGIPLEIAGKNPELEPLERVWNDLTKDQQADLISIGTLWAQRNKSA